MIDRHMNDEQEPPELFSVMDDFEVDSDDELQMLEERRKTDKAAHKMSALDQ